LSGKTDHLRELVLKIAPTTKVVEKPAKKHGTLRSTSEIEQALLGVVSEMIKAYNIQTKLTPKQLAAVVRLFYKGLSDTEIAEQLGDRALNKTVSRAALRQGALHKALGGGEVCEGDERGPSCGSIHRERVQEHIREPKGC